MEKATRHKWKIPELKLGRRAYTRVLLKTGERSKQDLDAVIITFPRVPSDYVAAVAADAATLRKRLLADAAAFAEREYLDGRRRRTRPFTLLARAYDDARQAVAFLRWNDNDLDLVAPYRRGNARPRR